LGAGAATTTRQTAGRAAPAHANPMGAESTKDSPTARPTAGTAVIIGS
jgi:hypothetical protein